MNMKALLMTVGTAAILTASCGYEPTRITLVNGLGSYNVEYLFISGTSEEDWGLNSLPGNTVLLPGDSIAIAVEAGRYDLQVIDEDGDTYTRWDQDVPEEGYRWEVRLGEMD